MREVAGSNPGLDHTNKHANKWMISSKQFTIKENIKNVPYWGSIDTHTVFDLDEEFSSCVLSNNYIV
jgi:hypothetical protein